MATDFRKRLTDVEVGMMQSSVKRLLTRHVVTAKHSDDTAWGNHLYALALRTVPQYIADAWEAMTRWYQAAGEEPSGLSVQAAVGIPTQFPSGRVLLLQYARTSAMNYQRAVPKLDGLEPLTVHAEEILGEDVATEIEEWGVHACQVTARALRSYSTACDVIKLASTVGQLHRICPELVRYTYDMTQEALKQQVRRSPVPDGWEKVDRVHLRDMLEHLALCYLLPDTSYTDYAHVTSTHDWCFDTKTRGMAAWPAQVNVHTNRLSTCDS